MRSRRQPALRRWQRVHHDAAAVARWRQRVEPPQQRQQQRTARIAAQAPVAAHARRPPDVRCLSDADPRLALALHLRDAQHVLRKLQLRQSYAQIVQAQRPNLSQAVGRLAFSV
eukprot:454830-Pleurochrysis_carterae.AAC.1